MGQQQPADDRSKIKRSLQANCGGHHLLSLFAIDGWEPPYLINSQVANIVVVVVVVRAQNQCALLALNSSVPTRLQWIQRRPASSGASRSRALVGRDRLQSHLSAEAAATDRKLP